MADAKNKRFNYENRGIPIEKLLAGPLLAAANANSEMAKAQAKFLLDFCFHKEGDVYRPITISMSLTKSVISPSENKEQEPELKQVSINFELPIITIIPINSLSVQDIEIDFEMEITSNFSKKQSENNGNLEDKNLNTNLSGNISYDSNELVENGKNQYQRKNRSKMAVTMKAGSLPLPVGLTTILDLYSKNIAPQQSEKK